MSRHLSLVEKSKIINLVVFFIEKEKGELGDYSEIEKFAIYELGEYLKKITIDEDFRIEEIVATLVPIYHQIKNSSVKIDVF